MPEAAIVLARFLHYASVLTLFGVSLFPLYTYPAHAGAPPERVRRLLRSMVLLATLAALLSGCFWFACVVAGMTGTPGSVFDRDALWPVLSETSFGKVSAARFLIAVSLLGLIATRPTFVTTSSPRLTVGFSAALLASLAGVGHTQIHEGIASVVHVGADGLHLLAAGAWLGGLLPLLYLVATAVRTPSPDHQVEAGNAALRFSGMGYVAVATIVGSGLLNGWFLVGSVAGLIATPYGQLLMLKLCLFAGMLALAAVNRFWLVPSLIKNKERSPNRLLFRLCAHVLGEQALGLMIILIVSAMGTMDPAINLQG
ncbi:copper homeostasis membrane protein CopD [Bradyrhizobium erythrophlei]|uniref:copper homeostasis membrane protein CopD n=1 Tax=Bradyrhizobium erythrophlei TaxID=1437360 RepID=UPI0035ED8A3A